MCPLVASPNRGYADWQRVDNWDTPLVWDVVQGSTNITIQSPVIDVSRFGYVAGQMFTTTGVSAVTFNWYSDPAKTRVVGERGLSLWSTMINAANMRIPNLGPFMQITVGSPDGANYDFQGHMFLTNRYHPLEFIPEFPVVLESLNVNLGPGATDVILPFDYYAGPAMVLISPQFAGTLAQFFRAFTTSQTNQFFAFDTQITGPQTVLCIIPPGGWICHVTNTSTGTATFSISVVPSMSGSS